MLLTFLLAGTVCGGDLASVPKQRVTSERFSLEIYMLRPESRRTTCLYQRNVAICVRVKGGFVSSLMLWSVQGVQL